MSDFEKNKINNDDITKDTAEKAAQEIINDKDNTEVLPKESDDVSLGETEGDLAENHDDNYSDERSDDEFSDDTPDDEPSSKKVSSVFKVWLVTRFVKLRKFIKKKPGKRVIISLVVLLLAVLVLTDLIPILPNSYNRFYVGNKYTLGETQGCDFESYGDNVLYADEGRVLAFGPDMEAEYKVTTFEGDPIIRVNGEGAAVFCPQTGDAMIIRDYDTYKIVKSDEVLKNVSVNTNGGYVFVCNKSGFNTVLKAYSSSHKLIYERNTNSDVVDAVLSDDSEMLIVADMRSSESDIYSVLTFFDTTKEESVISEVELSDNFITELYPCGNKVIAFGLKYTACYAMNGSEIWRISYADKEFKSFDISDDGNIAFLFNRYNSELSESQVEIYDFDGDKTGVYKSKENVRSISVNNDYCLLSFEGGTALIDEDGDLCKKKKASFDFSRVVLYDNYNFGFSVNDRVCKILSVKH
ncbi:MAG: hypothetical protein II998_11725 [Clostridia bacterium]|nr:hypothetical protein [Clostridia bacterium]